MRVAALLLLGSLAGAQVGSVQDTQPTAPDDQVEAAMVPPGFTDSLVVGGLVQATAMAFASDGLLFVAEQRGTVRVLENGVVEGDALLDLVEEVGAWSGQGLLGIAVDPDFAVNGWLYVLYTVDHYHLTTFGTPEYDPELSETFVDTVGRLVRYTVDTSGDHVSIVPGSRHVVLGDTLADAFPVCSTGHALGALAFGDDGTLFVSCGDLDAAPASGTCLAEGILEPKEDVGPFRAQLVDSLAGKVIRIDPSTGEGLSSNPFFDPGDSRAPRSRVWAMGLRQPFTLATRPGSGVADPAFGQPGWLLIGEVGQSKWEELDLASTGGMNFGWPVYEGFDIGAGFGWMLTPNLDAPNPLFDGVTCTQSHFDFQDLIVEDSLAAPLWDNPCAPGTPVVAPVPLHVHTRPLLAWRQNGQGAFVPTYDPQGEADSDKLGDPGTQVAGESFAGNCSITGTWYGTGSFPAAWHDTFFHADYGLTWIKNLVFDGSGTLVEVRPFAEAVSRIVDLDVDPLTGDLYYLNFGFLGDSSIRRVHVSTSNAPPVLEFGVTQTFGPAPLTVGFDADGTVDPEGDEITFSWGFGDGTPTVPGSRAVHVFPSEDVTDQGTIIGKVFELDPPGSMGPSSLDPEVIRDGVFPVLGLLDPNVQYDTTHVDPGGLPDKGGEDWIGYEFATDRQFTGVVFQEGMWLPGVGGWLTTMEVQVRVRGVWQTVAGAASIPVYPGLFVPTFERFDIHVPPMMGDAIRIFGEPGGPLEFFTIGELRVLATPIGPTPFAQGFEVAITATDAPGASATDGVTISVDNTHPVPVITAPANLGTYSTTTPSVIDLISDSWDVEHLPAELTCIWQVILHHDNHNHPGGLLEGCQVSTQLVTDGCPDVHYHEIILTVSDPAGLSASTEVILFPDCDLNHNGVDDAIDIASGTSKDHDGDGIPDELLFDCDEDGIPDVHEVFLGWEPDRNGNGRPDSCDPAASRLDQEPGPVGGPSTPTATPVGVPGSGGDIGG